MGNEFAFPESIIEIYLDLALVLGIDWFRDCSGRCIVLVLVLVLTELAKNCSQ